METNQQASATNTGIRVFDLHCDTLDTLCFPDQDYLSAHAPTIPADADLAKNPLQLSADRMREAGRWCQCYAVWVPDDLSGMGLTPHEFYDKASAYFKEQMTTHPDVFVQVRDGRKISEACDNGRIAAILTVENAAPLSDGIEVLDQMAADGVKMMTLTWNGANCIGSGMETLDGLTRFGKKVVHRMEELHMVVDVSHLNDAGFRDVLACSSRPFVATHSNSRAVCPHPRNLTDDEFRAIVDCGGIVGINYYRSFIADRFQDHDPAPAPGRKEITFDDLSFHIDHFLHLGGEKVIALGSDFDGSETPTWLSGAQDLPHFYELVARRFGADIADAMFWDNAANFFARNETA